MRSASFRRRLRHWSTQRPQISGCFGSGADVGAAVPAARALRRVSTATAIQAPVLRHRCRGDRIAGRSAAGRSLACEVISTKRSSSPSAAMRRCCASSRYTSTAASSGAPSSPAARSRSSSRATSVLSAITASQSIAPVRRDRRAASTRSRRSTEASRSPGRYFQISSAVNDRIGASQRTIASAMWYIAVCAERRAALFAGVVYSRSLMMSSQNAPSSTTQKLCTFW